MAGYYGSDCRLVVQPSGCLWHLSNVLPGCSGTSNEVSGATNGRVSSDEFPFSLGEKWWSHLCPQTTGEETSGRVYCHQAYHNNTRSYGLGCYRVRRQIASREIPYHHNEYPLRDWHSMAGRPSVPLGRSKVHISAGQCHAVCCSDNRCFFWLNSALLLPSSVDSPISHSQKMSGTCSNDRFSGTTVRINSWWILDAVNTTWMAIP